VNLFIGYIIPFMIFLATCYSPSSRSGENAPAEAESLPNILWIVGENLNLDWVFTGRKMWLPRTSTGWEGKG
jgi:hypothetical protein